MRDVKDFVDDAYECLNKPAFVLAILRTMVNRGNLDALAVALARIFEEDGLCWDAIDDLAGKMSCIGAELMVVEQEAYLEDQNRN